MIDGSVIGKVFIEVDDDKRDLMAINTVMDTPQRAGPKCTLLQKRYVFVMWWFIQLILIWPLNI